MCGRFILGVVREELEKLVDEYYGIPGIGVDFALPRYNVAPGQQILSVVGDGVKNRIGTLKWGFVPWFAKDEKGGPAMINVRAESILDKPLYTQSLAKKRCVVLADGFYEWKKDGSVKTPMRIFLKDARLFALAGLYSAWTRPDGTKLYSVTIVTCAANDFMRPIHERMPVILPLDKQPIWLGPESADLGALARLLIPYDGNLMDAHPVSTAVNDVRRDDPSLIEKA
ncbi:MAG TPA: hypothetical protein DCR44_06105 [Acholeplasmatales bacterium]|nr:MAG: hypothetical protein A2Y16_00490 [Tenericutes bacterium GWF2_57_13]HAQ56950.1 hypothetical protein [Acholeplasmatales bacterium]